MGQFRKAFAFWFAALMAFFLLANLAGLVRPMGLKPFRFTGFPLTVVAWGEGVEESFDWLALAVNVTVAIVASGLVGWLCAWARCRSAASNVRTEA